MLRLTLHQFRCWDNLVIEAPIGSVTLIKGYSGVGKTTILQGITWCLYGNIRLVGPNYLEKAKTRVMMELPYTLNGVADTLSITRQKNPNRLLLSHNGQVYEDKVAQSIIDDTFGTYEIWIASCYIGQGCRNSFLTAPNTGKMELLNSIAFHEEDPTTYIERIDSFITETDSDYKIKLSTFTNNLNAYQALVETVDVTKALTPGQTNDVNTQISNLTREKLSLQTSKSQRDINIGILNSLEKQLSQVNNPIKSIEPDPYLITINNKYGGGPIDTPDDIYANIERAMNIIPLLQRRDDLYSDTVKFQTQLQTYNLNDTNVYTHDDYQDAISRETAYRDSQRSANTLGVSYSDDAIRDTISHHRATLSSQERLLLENERLNLQNTISTLEFKYSQQTTPLIFPDITPREIFPPDYSKYNTEALSEELGDLSKKHGSIQAHIQHLQKGYDVLQCPHCNGPVRYQHGTLFTAETGPTNRDDIISAQSDLSFINAEIARITKTIHSLTSEETAQRASYERAVILEHQRIDSLKERVRQLELEQQRRDIANQAQYQHIQEQKNYLKLLTDKIDLLPECTGDKRILTPKEIEHTHSLIARLSTITILPVPIISSQHIQSCLTYQTLSAQSTSARSKYSDHLETIPLSFRTETCVSIHSYIDRLRSYWNQIKEIATENNRLQQLKFSLENQIRSTIDKIGIDPSPEIDRINMMISMLQESLALSIKAHKAIQYHAQITKEREEAVNLNNTLSDLHSLRQYAVDTECRILQEVVDSINASIESVCNTLFDRDINITLSLFKTLKTTKNVKPVANFSISYQGGVFDNINQLSGGEGDRASLALTLALNRLSSCPILMLDESLASLDINMKEAAIRAIRENTNNTVLIIMHDGVEGIFDNIIDLCEIREITNPH